MGIFVRLRASIEAEAEERLEEISRALQSAMEASGISLAEISVLTGLSENTIRALVQPGRRRASKIRNFLLVAAALKADVNALLNIEVKPKAP